MNNAELLQQYVERLPDHASVAAGYDHVGALLVDATLQAGELTINWKLSIVNF
jgi:hypothetical protein